MLEREALSSGHVFLIVDNEIHIFIIQRYECSLLDKLSIIIFIEISADHCHILSITPGCNC